MEKELKFKNGKFRILQLTDMQDTHRTSLDTVSLTRCLIEKTQPDLIVLTGDQIKGYGTYFKFGDDRKNASAALTTLLRPIEESRVPFTVVFGNHDSFGEADKDFQWSFYKKYANFIGNNYDFDSLPIFSENETDIPFCVYLFDSHGKDSNGRYSPVNKTQTDKYRRARDFYAEKCGHTVSALAFQHIPPAEIYDCLDKSKRHKRGSFKGAGAFSKYYYAMPKYAASNGGFMGENAASPDETGDELIAFEEKGDVLGLYFGHDHNNSFTVKYRSIDLGYTQCCGFNIYGPGLDRGGRVFDIDEKTPDKYETFTVTCRDLNGFKQKRPVKNFIYTHSPSSVTEAEKLIVRTAAITVTVLGVKKILNKTR